MVSALTQVAGQATTERIRWEKDPTIERIVGGWPSAWNTSRAEQLGLTGDTNFESVIRAYIEDDMVPAKA
jgi:hypothetical protein